MSATLTAGILRAKGACGDGIITFDATFPDGLDVCGWTAAQQLGVMMHPDLRRHLGWAWRAGILPSWSMAGWRMNGADLADADLAGAYLAGADLAGANLAGADLAGANLARANLAGANLAGADLARAYLAGANLAGAYLAGAWWGNRVPPIGWCVVDKRLRAAP